MSALHVETLEKGGFVYLEKSNALVVLFYSECNEGYNGTLYLNGTEDDGFLCTGSTADALAWGQKFLDENAILSEVSRECVFYKECLYVNVALNKLICEEAIWFELLLENHDGSTANVELFDNELEATAIFNHTVKSGRA